MTMTTVSQRAAHFTRRELEDKRREVRRTLLLGPLRVVLALLVSVESMTLRCIALQRDLRCDVGFKPNPSESTVGGVRILLGAGARDVHHEPGADERSHSNLDVHALLSLHNAEERD